MNFNSNRPFFFVTEDILTHCRKSAGVINKTVTMALFHSSYPTVSQMHHIRNLKLRQPSSILLFTHVLSLLIHVMMSSVKKVMLLLEFDAIYYNRNCYKNQMQDACVLYMMCLMLKDCRWKLAYCYNLVQYVFFQ